MAWIESHTVLRNHRKVLLLSKSLRMKPAHTIGHLHLLWHAAIEQQEDGDLSRWDDELIAEISGYCGDAPQFVRLLQEHGWLDGKMIHDWWDYAGRYLESKYRTANPKRLEEIKKKCSQSKDGLKTDFRPSTLPNLTLPNQTKQNITKPKSVGEKSVAIVVDVASKAKSLPSQSQHPLSAFSKEERQDNEREIYNLAGTLAKGKVMPK